MCEGELRRPANLVSLGSRKNNYEVIVNITPLLSFLRESHHLSDAEELSIEGKRCRELFCVSHGLNHPLDRRECSFEGPSFLAIYFERLNVCLASPMYIHRLLRRCLNPSPIPFSFHMTSNLLCMVVLNFPLMQESRPGSCDDDTNSQISYNDESLLIPRGVHLLPHEQK